ncbi:hypothetical protein [Amycolatopsis sp. lyj-90]
MSDFAFSAALIGLFLFIAFGLRTLQHWSDRREPGNRSSTWPGGSE